MPDARYFGSFLGDVSPVTGCIEGSPTDLIGFAMDELLTPAQTNGVLNFACAAIEARDSRIAGLERIIAGQRAAAIAISDHFTNLAHSEQLIAVANPLTPGDPHGEKAAGWRRAREEVRRIFGLDA